MSLQVVYRPPKPFSLFFILFFTPLAHNYNLPYVFYQTLKKKNELLPEAIRNVAATLVFSQFFPSLRRNTHSTYLNILTILLILHKFILVLLSRLQHHTPRESTVLLILAEGGVLVFSYPFSKEWRIDEDLFSSFLSAFTSFSTEFFSKGLDRAKFGDEMMLMESIGSFSFCYLFKGQTYSAKQKLTKFTEEMQKNTFLWQSLEQHYKTSQILDLKESPQLESLITEIFTSKS